MNEAEGSEGSSVAHRYPWHPAYSLRKQVRRGNQVVRSYSHSRSPRNLGPLGNMPLLFFLSQRGVIPNSPTPQFTPDLSSIPTKPDRVNCEFSTRSKFSRGNASWWEIPVLVLYSISIEQDTLRTRVRRLHYFPP